MVQTVTLNLLLFKRQEIWFYNNEEIKWYDNNQFYQALAKPVFAVNNLSEFNTLISDLTVSEEQQQQKFTSTIRNEIRRAQKEGVVCMVHEIISKETLEKFVASYNDFAKIKSLDKLNVNRFKAFNNSGALVISEAFISDTLIQSHCYIRDSTKCRLLTSHFNVDFTNNNLKGYANKYLHWFDMVFFKNNGLKEYDWGGVLPDMDDSISKFKLQFGGDKKIFYNFVLYKGLYKSLKK